MSYLVIPITNTKNKIISLVQVYLRKFNYFNLRNLFYSGERAEADRPTARGKPSCFFINKICWKNFPIVSHYLSKVIFKLVHMYSKTLFLYLNLKALN